MSDLLDVSHDECNKLSKISRRLRSLSGAFSVTGNDAMADKLFTLAEDIHKSQKLIRDAVGRDIHEGYKRSQEASANLLKTALAVSTLKGEQ